jgi:hypothetical protein
LEKNITQFVVGYRNLFVRNEENHQNFRIVGIPADVSFGA